MTDNSWVNSKGLATNEVAFDYVKSPDFRVVWADGVVGAVTPNGFIHFVLYAERQAIPRRQVFKLELTGEGTASLGAEVLEKQISRGSIVREMACDVFITPAAAESLADWLRARAAEAKKITGGNK